MLHILHNRLLANRLFDLALCLNIEWIHVQTLDLLLLLELCSVLPLLRLFEKLGKARGVVLGRGGEFWLCLRNPGVSRLGCRRR
jgi:hypothetical protein